MRDKGLDETVVLPGKHHEVVTQKLVKEKSQPMPQDDISVVPDVCCSGKKGGKITLRNPPCVSGVLKKTWTEFVK